MTAPWRVASTLWLLLVGTGCADQDGPTGCVMNEIADLPVLNSMRSPIVRADINGTPVAFIVDTGARLSTVTEHAADILKLPLSTENRHIIAGIGGAVFVQDATIEHLSLGTGSARNVAFAAIGRMDGTIDGLPLVGLFGGDFLANYDVEFDLPAHHIALYREQHCGGHIRPWANAFYEQPFDLQNDTEIRIAMKLDGKAIQGTLDSGAYRTILDSDSGRAGGANAATMAGDPANVTHGVDGNPVPAHLHTFTSLEIGPERFAPVRIPVADIPNTLLGADFLRSHRVWVSYPHEMLYIQRVRTIQHRTGPVPVAQAPVSSPLAPPPPSIGPVAKTS